VLVDKDSRAPIDTSQVNLSEEWEVRYWCERFEVGEVELRACIAEAGPRTVDVDERLRSVAKKAFWNMGED
jgi:hypothetical protein